jgi:hypothetical protein
MRFYRFCSNLFTKSSLSTIESRRGISTIITPSPEVVKMLFEADAPSSNPIPNRFQIVEKQQKLQNIYIEDKQFKNFADNLYKSLNNSRINVVAINFAKQTDCNISKNSLYFQSILMTTTLAQGLGFEAFYDIKNLPSHVFVDSTRSCKIDGHQDGIFLKDDDKIPSLMPYLALINAHSTSHVKTWIKEINDIAIELKEKYPKDYEILKQLNFIGISPASEVVHKGKIFSQDENQKYFMQFVSNFEYFPFSKELHGFGILPDQAKQAIERLKEVVNSEKNRQDFILNDKQTQIIFMNNQQVVHGRDQIKESDGLRLIVAIPLKKNQLAK